MKKVLNIVVNVLAWVVLIFAFLVTLIVFSSGKNNGVANLLGYMPMTVESDSMKPTFSKDDLIICKDIDDVYSLQVDDVVTFWTIIEGHRVKNTHRIVEIVEENGTLSFITRGDNNPTDDELPAYSSDLIGKWTGFKMSSVGKAMSFLRTKTGFFVCILIPMAIFFLIELYKFIVVLIEAKRPEAPELDEEEIKRRAIEEYLASQKQSADQAPAAAPETAKESAEKTEANAEKPEAKEEAAPAEAAPAADAEKVAEAAEQKAETAEKAADAVAEAAESAADKAENAAEKVAETVSEQTEAAAEAVAEKISEQAEAAAEAAAEKKSEQAEAATEAAAEKISEQAEAAAEAAAEKAEDTVKNA